mmetsp:Transcript_34087/g.77921  ORF Transcript_34087/g.77921 Transcript_34087/m.77921 type:complete len:94 (-) Transcript_34087:4-285(-)
MCNSDNESFDSVDVMAWATRLCKEERVHQFSSELVLTGRDEMRCQLQCTRSPTPTARRQPEMQCDVMYRWPVEVCLHRRLRYPLMIAEQLESD